MIANISGPMEPRKCDIQRFPVLAGSSARNKNINSAVWQARQAQPKKIQIGTDSLLPAMKRFRLNRK